MDAQPVKPIRKAISVFISLAMALALVPAVPQQAEAANIKDYHVCMIEETDEGYSDYSYAVSKANDINGTIKLLKSFTETDVSYINGNVTIDLNGKTLTTKLSFTFCDYGIYVIKGAHLTIKDSSGGSGSYVASHGAVELEQEKTSFTLEGAKIVANGGSSDKGGVYIDDSDTTFTMNGGSITTTGGGAGVYINDDTATVNINGGSITAQEGGSTIYCPSDKRSGTKINIKENSKLYSRNSRAIYLDGFKSGTLNIEGGSITSDQKEAIFIDGENCGSKTKINVSGGTITSNKYAAFSISGPSGETLKISGGTFNGATSGLLIANGFSNTTTSVEISNGTFDGSGRRAYSIDIVNALSSSITGGRFKSHDSVDIYMNDCTKVTTTVTGGTFDHVVANSLLGTGCKCTKNEDGTYTVYKQPCSVSFDANGGTLASGTKTLTVESGKTARKPDDPTKENGIFLGWSTAKSDGSIYDFSTPVTGDMTLYAQWKHATCKRDGKLYATLAEAVDSSKGNGAKVSQHIITMVDDEELKSSITARHKGLTIDLNGHQLTTSSAANVITMEDTVDLYIVDNSDGATGSIVNSNAAGSGIYVGSSSNLYVESGRVYGAKDGISAAGYNSGPNIFVSGGEVEGGDNGISVGEVNATAEISGGTVKGGTYAVYLHGSNASVKVTGGSLKAGAAGSASDIYDSYGDKDRIDVFGGVFGKAVPQEQCADGSIAADNDAEATKTDYPYTVTAGYKVTFNANGGVMGGDESIQYVKAGSTATAPSAPTRDGWTFMGWCTDEGATQNFDFSTAVDANTTLYAKWAQGEAAHAKHMVAFDANGGKLTGDATVQVEAGGTLIEPKAPTRSGYNFAGWATAAQGTAITFPYTVDSCTTMYAQWEQIMVAEIDGNAQYATLQEAFEAVGDGSTATVKLLESIELADAALLSGSKTVTLDMNGCSLSSTDISTISVSNGAALTVKNNGKKRAYVKNSQMAPIVAYDAKALAFGGGLLSIEGGDLGNEGTGQDVSAGIIVANSQPSGEEGNSSTRETAVTIQDQVAVRGSYMAAILSGPGITFNVTGGYIYSRSSKTSTDIVASNGVKVAVSGGVFTKEVPQSQCAAGKIPAKNEELSRNTYPYTVQDGFIVSFNANGGTLAEGTDSQAIATGAKAKKPSDPKTSAAGYGFDGWHTQAEGGTAWDFGTDTVTSNITLYAHWKATEYTITYDGLDGIAGVGNTNPESYNVESEAITLAAPTWTGDDTRIFLGWYRTVKVESGESKDVLVSEVPAGSTGNITLTAKWEHGVASITDDDEKTTYYDILDGAFDAAGEDATIVLLSNVKLSETITVSGSDKALTLDLNGHSVTSTANEAAFSVKDGASLGVGDRSDEGTGSIEGATCAVEATGDSLFGLLSGTLKTTSAGTALSVKGTESADASSFCIAIVYDGKIEGGSGTGVGVQGSTAMLLFMDGSVSGAQAIAGDDSSALYVAGGTIDSDSADSDITATSGAEVAVFGGVFTHPVPVSQAAEGYEPCTNDDGTYGVKAGTYTVSFDANGGKLSGETSVSVTYPDAVAKPADPSRDGYSFAGWTTDAAGKQAYDFETAITGDITLYAQWAKKATPAKKAAKTFTVNVKTVTAKAVKAAAKKAGATAKSATSITLGKKVKKVKKGAFKSFKKLKTITVKTKKLTKKSVKKALKSSKVKTIKVKIGSKKVNKKYVKKYKKIFTKKVAGKKAKVK